MWYPDTMEYYSAIKRNKFESVIVTWLNLEPAKQSKCQKEKSKDILTHVYGIQKDGTDEPLCRTAWLCRHREHTGVNSGGRRGRDRLRELH